MKEILLIRHAESTANMNDVAFCNLEAPLTQKALEQQIPHARTELLEKYGINPEEYDRPVLASEYNRTFQTAHELGFRLIDRLELINESDIYHTPELKGVNVINKHVEENGWLPEEEQQRAQKIIEQIRTGTLDYEIIFSHGMVIAGILSELNRQRVSSGIIPDPKRGHVPLQAQIIKVEL